MSQDNTAANISHDSKSPKSLRLIIGLVALLILAVIISLVANNNSTSKTNTAAKSATPSLAYVKISDDGFTPATLSITKGTVVVWQVASTSTKTVVVASNPYPKDSDLKALKSTQIGAGASYRYQFNVSGTYKYHDDLNPTTNGSIVVRD